MSRDVFLPSRRDLLIGGAVALAAGTAYARIPRKRMMFIGDGELEKIVPARIADWETDSGSGVVLPPPDQLAALLYSQQVARTYMAEDRLPIMLLMAYGSSQSGMMQIHRPEICYPASGFKLSDTREIRVDLGGGRSIPTQQFTAKSDTRLEQVLYWTRVGDMLPVDWAAQRIAVFRNSLAGVIPDGLLVRLSTVSEDDGQAQAALDMFARAMLAAIGTKGRRMLIGSANA